jgi:lipoprotein-anchoring transpeptidase ErfK/SrfK
VTTVAQAVVPKVPVYSAPKDGLPVAQTLGNPRPLGGPLAMVVLDQQPGWLNVSLPVRPNESSGWVKSSDFSLSQHSFRIAIELAAHRITVYNGYSIVDQEPVGVGTSATPTAGGIFYTADEVQVVPPTGPYGPYAFGLSGFSNVLTSFGGGPGQLAIHGTNQPQFIGQDVSHGCIRMSNAGITKLAHMLPLGVPVAILA